MPENEKFCTSCGALIPKAATFCQNCGAAQPGASAQTGAQQQSAQVAPPPPLPQYNPQPQSPGISRMPEPNQEGAETIAKVGACWIPLLGAILYFVWKDTKPQAASDVCHWAIGGFVIGIVLYIIGIAVGATGM